MKKSISYVISIVLSIGIFIISALLHKSSVESGGIISGGDLVGNGTQVQFIGVATGLVYYLIFLVMMVASTYFGRRTSGNTLSCVISLFLFCLRGIAALTMVSGGSSIYIFENKLLAILQLIMMFSVVPVNFMMPAKGKEKTQKDT